MAPEPQPRWLDPEEDRAWRGWLLMSDLLRWQLFHDLQTEAGLSDADFVVLVHLSEAADSRLRMTDLAGALRWSKSRLSHQFTRMEARGLVRRENCTQDGRTTYAVLTASGRAEITRAAPLHLASVRRHFIDLLDREQITALGAISETMSRHLLEAGSGGEHGAPPCPTTRDSLEALETLETDATAAGACGSGDLLSGPATGGI
jgi:DNA-binding MarR family transcriptional regulator